jgi:hypothetical protein
MKKRLFLFRPRSRFILHIPPEGGARRDVNIAEVVNDVGLPFRAIRRRRRAARLRADPHRREADASAEWVRG